MPGGTIDPSTGLPSDFGYLGPDPMGDGTLTPQQTPQNPISTGDRWNNYDLDMNDSNPPEVPNVTVPDVTPVQPADGALQPYAPFPPSYDAEPDGGLDPPMILPPVEAKTSVNYDNWSRASEDMFEDMWDSYVDDPYYDDPMHKNFSRAFVYGFASPFYRATEGKWYQHPRTEGTRLGGTVPRVPLKILSYGDVEQRSTRTRRKKRSNYKRRKHGRPR